MYNNVSEEFVNLIGDSGRTFKAKLVNASGEITDIRSITLYQAENGEDNIGIGGCVASYIECTIGNTTFQLENVEYELQIGIKTDEENYEYVPIGKFTPKKPDIKSEVTTFIAYDRMMSKGLSYGYFSDIENYPVDAKAILIEIQEQTGIEIDISELPDGVMVNKRKVISDTSYDEEGEEIQKETYEKPFTGYTKQEAICYIAQLYGKFAFTDRYGIVRFRWFESCGLQYDKNQYKDDVKQSEKEFTLGVIKCGDFVSGAGAIGISIDNPVMTQEILDDVYQKIGGFKCRGISLTLLGDLRIDIGDIIQVNINDEYMDIPVMRLETHFDGGISQKVYAYGSTDEVEEKRGPTAQRLDRMYNELLLVKEIMANKVSADNLEAKIAHLGFASIDRLTAEVAKMGLMTAKEADIRYATVQKLNILQGNFAELEGRTLTVETMDARLAELDYLTAAEAGLTFLSAADATLKYAKIDFSNIANGTITTAMIATGAIETAQIADGSITDAKIVGLTANKITAGILDAAVIEVVNLNAANITVGTINGKQIAPSAITAEKIASGAVTNTHIAANTITGSKIAAGTISSTNIASNAITADKIVASAVTADKIASSAITTNKLAANAVTGEKIAAGTITADKINVSSLSALSANLGTVTAGIIQSANYVKNSTGMQLNLSTGTWDSNYFKISKDGKIDATGGTIGCFTLSPTGLDNAVLKISSNKSNTAMLSIYDPTIEDPIFDISMAHPANSMGWSQFLVNHMNEIRLSADDIFLNGEIYINDKSLLDLIYPVGSIYLSIKNVNPSTLFGGTWVAWGTGRVPVGVNTSDGNFNTVEKTGGASTVTLTASQMPPHTHGLNAHSHSAGTLSAASSGAHTHTNKMSKTVASGTARVTIDSNSSSYSGAVTNRAGAHTHTVVGNTGGASGNTTSVGGGGGHINLQPYITCYMWKRTA